MNLAVVIATLIAVAALIPAYLLIGLVNQARKDGLSPENLKTLVTLLIAIVGGLWAAFNVSVSGSLEFARLQFEQARNKNIPNLDIDIQVQTFPPVSEKKLVPLYVNVVVKNPGFRTTHEIDLKSYPLLLIARASGESPRELVKPPITALPYVKLKCVKDDCGVREFESTILEAGGSDTYVFLHPGLVPGLYYVQFQLPVPKDDLIYSKFDPRDPLLWTRSIYVYVTAPKNS